MYYIVIFDSVNWTGLFNNKEKAFKAIRALGPYRFIHHTGLVEWWDIIEDDYSVGKILTSEMNMIATDL